MSYRPELWVASVAMLHAVHTIGLCLPGHAERPPGVHELGDGVDPGAGPCENDHHTQYLDAQLSNVALWYKIEEHAATA